MLQYFAKVYGKSRSTLFYHLCILIFFSIVYFNYLTSDDFNSSDKLENYSDYLYFSVITHSSVGYGDISPKTPKAKKLVMLHVIITFSMIISLWV